jgi:ElaB/YqjD/DUF883 family membrane-anchored ribosome-binding protein
MHISETKLELFAVDSAKFSEEERTQIEAHLEECRWCSEMLEQLLETYGNFAQEQADQAEVHGRARLENHLPILRDVHDTPVQVSLEGKPTRFVRVLSNYIKQHPIASGATVSFAALLVLALLCWRGAFTSPNPHQALAKDGFLRVFDANGREIWSHFVDQEYSFSDSLIVQGSHRVLKVCDVDGDGKNEVLGVTGFKPSLSRGNAIFCFKSDGELLWEYPLHGSVRSGSRTFSDDYRSMALLVGDFDRDRRVEVVVLAQHMPWEPSVLLLLDAATGKPRGEYWHLGHFSEILNYDLDKDGIEEIVGVANNNSYNANSVIVLDPRAMNGQAPAPADKRLLGISSGSQKFFVLLPRSDLEKASLDLKPSAGRLVPTASGTLMISSSEALGADRVDLIFEFNSKMECVGVKATDHFLGVHRKLEREGVLTQQVDAQYLERLRKEVQYWDGERFRFLTYEELKEAVINSRYLQMTRE